MSLSANFQSTNAFLVGDVKQPTSSSPNYEVKAAIREYGQLTFEIPPAMLSAAASQNTLVDGELGYPLSDFIGNLSISGAFTRVRKSPTAAPSLVFTVTSIA